MQDLKGCMWAFTILLLSLYRHGLCLQQINNFLSGNSYSLLPRLYKTNMHYNSHDQMAPRLACGVGQLCDLSNN